MVLPYLVQYVIFVLRCWSSHGLKCVDTGAAAPKRGLRMRLYGERCGGGSGLSLFGHVDGVERMVGDPTVHIASSLAAPRSRFEGLTRRQWAAEFLGAVQGFFRPKAQRISANGSDACWCRKPLRDVIVVILLALWLRVKPLTSWSQQRRRCTSLHSQGHRRGALVPLDIVPMSSVASFSFSVFLFFLIFDLLCKRFSSPPYIGLSVRPLWLYL
jgi:hypothetical protein